LRTPSEFIHVTSYAALRYLPDFKAGWSFGEGQVKSSSNNYLSKPAIVVLVFLAVEAARCRHLAIARIDAVLI
jgi:hypothetical protein